MKTIQKLIITSILTLGFMGIAQAENSVDDIIKQNIEAKGGIEKLDSIKTIKLLGTMSMQGMELPFEMIQKRPNKIYTSFEVQGMKGKQVYDGKIGWMVMPFMGKTEAEEMADDQLKDFQKQADIDGPLRNYKDKGNVIEYIGESEIEGTPVVELKITDKDGDITSMFFDKDYMLEIKTKSKVERMGIVMEIETTIGNYKDIDGLIFPHSIATKMGEMGSQEITINSIVINEEVDDSLFTMPAKKVSEVAKKAE